MGMRASYRRLTSGEFQRLLDDPGEASVYFGCDFGFTDMKRIYAYLDRLSADERYLDIDKNWHGLHFLLTDSGSLGATQVLGPLGNVVLGGTPTKWEASYGPVRFLTPREVKEVADALAQLNEEDLRRRYDSEAFLAADIYPQGWDQTSLDYLMAAFCQVRDFFKQAAEEGNVVLLSCD